ncbi:hypothetical protein DPEC_G00206350 [Dallia pectoralis]|uniref:Uncharacterized protein n=1 Tax=Dallia pectoralis TaxID=75939 RepID=A0ACC2G4M1_DALPE|nr:hypothetical protein DPEC_G00206350 [Dallia pectoralis]
MCAGDLAHISARRGRGNRGHHTPHLISESQSRHPHTSLAGLRALSSGGKSAFVERQGLSLANICERVTRDGGGEGGGEKQGDQTHGSLQRTQRVSVCDRCQEKQGLSQAGI